MEENEYRNTYQQVNHTRCAFENAILARRCDCKDAHRFNLAEREGIACQAKNHQKRCQNFLQQAREKALFVLKLTHLDAPLTHAREIRVQLGSLNGLSELLDGAEPDTITDVNYLLNRAEDKYVTMEEIPPEILVRAIMRLEGRKRNRKKS